jgi:heterodisulfide reductase subunit A-like polyferredoxin
MYPDLITSEAISVTDMDKCVNDGTCVERCHFEAREMVDGQLKVNDDLCYGCGLCISTCPSEAISLVRK